VACWAIWLRRHFLSFLSFSLFLPWKMCCPIKNTHLILLFCLDSWFSPLVFYCMIFVLISFMKFKFVFDLTLDWNIIFFSYFILVLGLILFLLILGFLFDFFCKMFEFFLISPLN
jgi:hypothetical protein